MVSWQLPAQSCTQLCCVQSHVEHGAAHLGRVHTGHSSSCGELCLNDQKLLSTRCGQFYNFVNNFQIVLYAFIHSTLCKITCCATKISKINNNYWLQLKIVLCVYKLCNIMAKKTFSNTSMCSKISKKIAHNTKKQQCPQK